MKKDNWEVKDYGIRPAGNPDECFYCGTKKGGTHKEDCVIRSRTIVMKMEVEMVLTAPEDWDEDMCNFHKNEGGWCATNIISELERMDNKMGCLCSVAEFEYLREATEEDEEKFQVFAKDIPQ